MGFFNDLSELMGQASVALIITRAKEGKLTVMMYPTNQKDDETFIPISITDLPEVLDDNIGDIMKNHLTTAIERFDNTDAEPTASAKSSPGKANSKKNETKDKPKNETAPKKEEPPKPPEKIPNPDLFSDSAEDPEDHSGVDIGVGNEVDTF